MNIDAVYKKYMTPKNLQEHMLRVAALSKIITDNWTGESLNNVAIIKACLMHDISKPVNFSTSKATQEKYGMTPGDVADLEKLKNYIANNFGTDEHKAAVEMCKDMNMDEKVIHVVENIEWKYTSKLLKENNLNALIAIYCDMRIGPSGILSLKERFSNLRDRRGGDNDAYLEDAIVLENKLQEKTNIGLNSITEEELESLFPTLLGLDA